MKYTESVLSCLDKSPSVFHVVANMVEELKKKGFVALNEEDPYELEAGKGYYVTRNGTSVIAFFIPKERELGYRLVATHNDSPSFAVKPNPLLKGNGVTRLNVEPYGGGIFYTWLDRPLSFAGRVVVQGKEGLETYLVDAGEDLLVIPSLAIHMNRSVNEGCAFNAAKDMVPLFLGKETEGDFNDYLKKTFSLPADVLSHDLFLYVRESPRILGEENDLLLAPRLDDLSSAYASLAAFLDAAPKKEAGQIPLFASFDNEEVGSLTAQGANSDFLKSTLARIGAALGDNEEQRLQATALSLMLSVDNAHATHPNHAELADATSPVYMNKGIVIKYNAAQKYTTNAVSSAYVKSLCLELGQSYQEFTNRSDMRGGSTLGNISNAEVSLLSADIGIAQLAMHSSVETCGLNDIEDMAKLLAAHYDR